MIILGKKLIMGRGDSVTLHCEMFIHEDETVKVPYTIPMNLHNPYLLFQISNSNMFEGKKGAVYNYWLPADFILPCKSRIPVLVSTKEEGITKDTLYYTVVSEERQYFYYDGSTQKDYSCQFKKTILPLDSKKWREQDWYYGVSIVAGEKTVDYLRDMYQSMGLLGTDDDEANGFKSAKWLYDRIKSYDCTKVNGVDPYSLLVNSYTFDKIEKAEKLVIE